MNEKKVLVSLPLSLINKIRRLSTHRKEIHHESNTQKSIIVELLHNGLQVADNVPSSFAEPTTPQVSQEFKNVVPLF